MTYLAALGDLSHLPAIQPEKPTVIHIPGAFHNAAHLEPLSRYLDMQGYNNFPIRLPSIGFRAGESTAGLAEDVATIRRVLEALVWDEEGGDGKWGGNDDGEHGDDGTERNDKTSDPRNGSSNTNSEPQDPELHQPMKRNPGKKDVVIVMHSYGAVPGCQAITNIERSHRIKEGKKGGVISLFFIGGLLGPILQPVNATPFLYGDLPPEQAERWESKLDPQSASVYGTAVQNTCWNLDIPVTYVTCTKDPQARVTDALVAKMKNANWTIETIESGSCPWLSCLEKVGDLIMRAGKLG
ncbi:MAG: hypothetical protein ASARMPREDX12_002827 [Alectoria sarmentosa]|nr:MAG: hypothetical protein ASARMPREDX12_002827 [Alectoria sarmentosa]